MLKVTGAMAGAGVLPVVVSWGHADKGNGPLKTVNCCVRRDF